MLTSWFLISILSKLILYFVNSFFFSLRLIKYVNALLLFLSMLICLISWFDKALLQILSSSILPFQEVPTRFSLLAPILLKEELSIKLKIFDDYITIEYHSDKKIDNSIYEIIEMINN